MRNFYGRAAKHAFGLCASATRAHAGPRQSPSPPHFRLSSSRQATTAKDRSELNREPCEGTWQCETNECKEALFTR